MGFEGSGRFEGYSEIPRGNSYGEKLDPHERKEQHEGFWIAGIINPEKLERIRAHPASEGHSTEWIIMQSLLGKLVESGPELNPYVRARLRNLVAAFRVLSIPNLTEGEQRFMKELASATTIDWSSLQYEVNQDTIGDVQELWRTFNLNVPSRNQMRLTMGDAGEAMHELLGLNPNEK